MSLHKQKFLLLKDLPASKAKWAGWTTTVNSPFLHAPRFGILLYEMAVTAIAND